MLSPALQANPIPQVGNTANDADRAAWLNHPITRRHIRRLADQLLTAQTNAQVLSRLEDKSHDALIHLRSADILSSVIQELNT